MSTQESGNIAPPFKTRNALETKPMWNERYSAKEYAHGTEPNTFLETHFRHLPTGRVLSLAEGEGRNAVFLAQQGCPVTAVDGSQVGLSKAQALAAAKGAVVQAIGVKQ